MSRMKHLIAEWAPLWMRMGGRRILYWGTAEVCPMCQSRVRTFLQNGSEIPILRERKVVGGIPRAGDRCPVCHALDRMRLMRMFLERETEIATARRSVLHVAPELGLLQWFRRLPHLDYTGTDLSPLRYRHVPNFVRADLTRLPFADGQFDIVVCSHVLEHVPDDAKAMSEIHRVTKPGGLALALTPLATDERPTDEDPQINDASEQERRFGQWDHVRLYHRDDLVHRLGQAGFEVTLWDPYRADADQAAAWHLNPDELLPVCRRPSVEGGLEAPAWQRVA